MTSDHVPIMINFENRRNNKIIQKNTLNQRKVYNLNKADWKKFMDLLPKTIPIGLDQNVEEINKFIVDSIINSADKTIPVYKVNNCHRKNLPNYIIELIKLRKKTKNFTKRDNDPNIKTRYNKLTALIREEIDAVKNNEWNEFI